MGYIFISYSTKNHEAADQVKTLLNDHGIQTWMAPGDIPPTRKYPEVINQALKNCAGLFLLLTDESQRSVWVAKEVERAISYHKPVLSVMLGDVILNDEFTFYTCNDQGIRVSRIDRDLPEIQRALAILRVIASDIGSGADVQKYIIEPTEEIKRKAREAAEEEAREAEKQEAVRRRRRLTAGLASGLLVLALAAGSFYVGNLLHMELSDDNGSSTVSTDAAPQIDSAMLERYYKSGWNSEKGNPPDLETALYWYASLADMDYAPAYIAAGRVCVQLEKYADAEAYLKQAAAIYEPEAFVLLGQLYEEGLGVERNLKQAIVYYQEGYRRGNHNATCALARLYAAPPEGADLTADPEKAIQLYTEAAQANHLEAAYRLGLVYESRDREMAIFWLSRAYLLGYAQAEYKLEELMSGDDLDKLRSLNVLPDKDPDSAPVDLNSTPVTVQAPDNTADVLLRAAKGDAAALLDAACLYFNGSDKDGIAADHQLALTYLTRAGDALYNHADAMLIMGYYHEGNEDLLPADLGKAEELYILAAEKGNLTACERLAYGYYNGTFSQGVPDYEKCSHWASVGAEKNRASLMYILGLLYKNGNYAGNVKDYAKAEEWYLKAAEQDHPSAMNNLGVGYCTGIFNGGTPDYVKGKEWYEKAAALNNVTAMRNIASNYKDGRFGSGGPDYDQAIAWYLKAAEHNDVPSMTNLGYGYSSGQFNGGVSDYEKAREWYEKAAALNGTMAMRNLAANYWNGNFSGGKPDYAQAQMWYEKAAALQDEEAMFWLGCLYQDAGMDGADADKAVAWFEQSADLGYADAMLQLGIGFHEGTLTGGAPEYEKAVGWYEKAAEKENAVAMYQLGRIYQDGHLGTPDYEKAQAWYERSAGMSYPLAMHNLGYGYSIGIFGGAPDYEKAIGWYEKAAEQNSLLSMQHLAIGFQNGILSGGTPDYARAVEWYEKSAALGDILSISNLMDIYLNGARGSDGSVLFAPDMEKGLYWLQQAEAAGTLDTRMLSWLGWFYAGNSDFLEADFPRAVAYYARGAALNDAYCMCQLGLIYGDTHLGEPDYELAAEWFEKSAMLNHSNAMCQLGLIYHNGYLGAPDYERSREWYEKAAALNNVIAMRNLAAMYWNGEFTEGEPDCEKTIEWYRMAADLNDGEAMYWLGIVYMNELADYDAAEYWLKQAYSVEGSDRAQDGLEELEQLRAAQAE